MQIDKGVVSYARRNVAAIDQLVLQQRDAWALVRPDMQCIRS